MQQVAHFMMALNAQVFLVTMCFIVLDVLTGYGQAICNRCLSSDKMRKGFWHKLAIIFALLVAGMVDVCIQIGIGSQIGFATPIFECACIYIIVMELTSILENVCKMNPELANNKIMELFKGVLPNSSKSGTIDSDGEAPVD